MIRVIQYNSISKIDSSWIYSYPLYSYLPARVASPSFIHWGINENPSVPSTWGTGFRKVECRYTIVCGPIKVRSE